MKWIVTAITLASIAYGGGAWAQSAACNTLASAALPDTTIDSAAVVASGTFTPPRNNNAPPGGAQNAIYATLPAFCRVVATVRPVADSAIRVEIWLPLEGWNGRLQALGNGGFSSAIQYNNLAQAILNGYVATGTNTGFDGNDSSFSIGHPGKIKDWGHRAVHEMAVTAKAVIAEFYGKGPNFSYWNSCSTGGRQGWVAAEYYPEDFDGLAIGDPANPMTRLQANSIFINRALNSDPASFINAAKWASIHRAVMNKCDAVDGLKDGFIQNPLQCNFRVNTLQCKQGDADDCLTAPQLAALKKILAGSRNPRTGAQLYPGYPLGTDMALAGPVVRKDVPDGSAPSTFRMLFQDADWDYRSFDFDRDTTRADQLGNDTINAVNPEKLQPLFARGGKLLLYHGWEDPAISPLISVQLYEQAVAANGGLSKTYDKMRLFLVPAMPHCQGGYGPTAFDRMAVLTDWVEKGKAPDQIIGSHATAGTVDRTRPLCPYPQVAKYRGRGSIDEAANFSCAAP